MMLSILCVTKNEPHSAYFLSLMRDLAFELGAEFCVAVDGGKEGHLPDCDRSAIVHSGGFVESVLDQALGLCRGRYVLRLDDDETVSPAMERWLASGAFLSADHWKFPRAHLWPDAQSMVVTPHLWPDVQTRLSVIEKSGGRRTIHAGSPFGGGAEAPVMMEHHKFLIRDYASRLAIAKTYDKFHPGYGTGGMKPFSLPEDVYDEVDVIERGDGSLPLTPSWTKKLSWRVTA